MKKRSRLITFLSRVFRKWREALKTKNSYTPTYRIVNIEQNAEGEYHVAIQLIGKARIFKMAPEKLLADDSLVKCFSPIDIRTLTYLGYLGINSPKYKILAKRLSEENEQMVFILQRKGEKKYKAVTADEISKNQEIIEGLSQKESHMIGLTTGIEQPTIEKKQKESALKLTGKPQKNDESTSKS